MALVSTSLIASDKLNTNSYHFFLKHLSYISLGISILIFFSFLSQKVLIKISFVLFLVTFLTLFLVPFIGIEIKGSKRWLDLFFLPRFQPIEILKPFFIITLSLLLSLKNRKLYLKYFLSTIILFPILLIIGYKTKLSAMVLALFTILVAII